jgi:cytochrome c oxidase assembly protein subunit 11
MYIFFPEKTKHILMKKNTQTALNVVAIVVGMLGLAYGSVPLYEMFCKVTGFGGTTQIAKEYTGKVLEKQVEVLFNTDVAPELNWSFKAEQSKVKVKIGENKLVFFEAKNISNKPQTGVALYNVVPHTLGKYFNKTQCFCFENQLLQPGEKMIFPVSFFIDPEMINDKNVNKVEQITLSYSFFEAKDSARK